MAPNAHPFANIILSAVMSNKKELSYQTAAYINKQDKRMHIILTNPTNRRNWGINADAVLLSGSKIQVRL